MVIAVYVVHYGVTGLEYIFGFAFDIDRLTPDLWSVFDIGAVLEEGVALFGDGPFLDFAVGIAVGQVIDVAGFSGLYNRTAFDDERFVGLRNGKMVNPIEVEVVVVRQASGGQNTNDTALYIVGWGAFGSQA